MFLSGRTIPGHQIAIATPTTIATPIARSSPISRLPTHTEIAVLNSGQSHLDPCFRFDVTGIHPGGVGADRKQAFLTEATEEAKATEGHKDCFNDSQP